MAGHDEVVGEAPWAPYMNIPAPRCFVHVAPGTFTEQHLCSIA
jgi:hypothetical protein